MQFIGWLARHPRFSIGAAVTTALVALVCAIVGFEALVRVHLNPAGAGSPTRLYARPAVWRSGDRADQDRVDQTLRRLGYSAARGRSVGIGEYRLESEQWTIGRRPFRIATGADSGGITHVSLDWGGRVNAVTDDTGRELAALTLEPQVLQTVHGEDLSDRVPVALTDVPPHLVNSILAVEDRRFFEHGGWDAFRVVGAAVANAKAGRITQGGSTITQQLARTLWLSPERSPWRKLREIAMAKVLEWRYTKTQILEAYLNEVYLGQDGGLAVRGVGRASRYYFGKSMAELDAGEAALLAGIIRGPNLYAPFRNPAAAQARRDLVLDVLLDLKLISDREYRVAQRAPLRLRRQPEPAPGGRYFADWVLRNIDASRPGLSVFTTLDPDLQRAADAAIAAGLRRIEQDHPALQRDSQPLQAALIALDPHTGEVLALVGGRDYRSTQFNRAIHALRQPGSAFKPVVALAALMPPGSPASDSGLSSPPPFTLATELDDDTLSLETTEGVWRPANYDSSFGGPVTLREALEHSLNVPFARLGLAVGPDRIAEMGHALGIESPLHRVPSLALGASEVTLLELTRAYGVLAAYGYLAHTVTTLGVVDAAGEVEDSATFGGERAVTPAVAYLLTSGLEGVVEHGTGRALRGWGVHGAVAGKTGTTNDTRDAWFVGYTPRLVVGVWVGFDDGKSLGLSGAGAALPIVAEFLRNGPAEDDAEFPVPEGVQFAYAGRGCEREAFLEGTVPEQGCTPDWIMLKPIGDGLKALVGGLKRLFGGRR